MIIPHNTTLYFRPTAFNDALINLDGQFARLPGGLQFFSEWDVIAVGGRVWSGKWLTPVDPIDDFIAALTSDQAAAAHQTIASATSPYALLALGNRAIRLDQPQVIGIINMTPDSFSDGSDHLNDPATAASRAVVMSAAGAAIIDIEWKPPTFTFAGDTAINGAASEA